MTPEGKAKRKISEFLKSMEDYGVWYFMPIGGQYGKKGIPDYIICICGQFVGVEVKAFSSRNKVTKIQQRVLNDIRAAGGAAVVVNSEEMLLKFKKFTWGMIEAHDNFKRTQGSDTEAEGTGSAD